MAGSDIKSLPRETLEAEVLHLRAELEQVRRGGRYGGDRTVPAEGDQLFAAIESASVPMILTDPRQPDEPIVMVNQAFVELSGYSADELKGRNCRFLQGKDTDPAQIDAIRKALRAKKTITLDILNYRRDGSSFMNELFISPVLGPDGEASYHFGSQIDVTEHYKDREALAASERRLRAVFDSSSDFAIVVTDREGRVTEWNTGAEAVLGWTVEEMRGQNAERFFTPEDRESDQIAVEMTTALRDGRASDERWHIRKGGERFWASGEMVPLLDANDEHAGFVKILRDRTSEHLAGTALRETEAQLRDSEATAHENTERVSLALAAGAIIGTWFWDLPSDRFTVDEAFACAFGLDPALGRSGIPLAQIVATVHPDDQAGLAAAINEAVARGGRYAHQYRVRRHDGRYYWLEANGHVEHAPDGTPLRFPGVLLDVAARRLEAALARLSEQLRTLDTPQAMALAAAETVGTALGLSRAAYGDVELEGQEVVLAQDWLAPGQPSAAGRHSFASYGTYIHALKRGENIAVEDVTTDPRTADQAASFAPLQIRGLANLPLMEKGRLKVILCLHTNHPHGWTSDELDFARRVMDRTEVEIARRRAEAEVKEGAERLRLVIEGASDHAILTTDPAGTITSWSAGAEAIFGWSAGEIISQPAATIFTPEDRAAGAPEKELATARQQGCANDERWHETKSGRRVFMNGSVRPLPPDAQGRERGFMKIARDETQRRQADAALRELNETLEQRVAERTADRNALWLLSSDIMLRCTFEGVMTAVNPAWTEVLGWREDELLGTSLFDWIHPDDMARTLVGAQELSRGIGHARFDNRYRHRDGSYRWITWTTRAGDGLINAVGRDFTADKEKADALAQTEEALRQSQKMEAVGQLTGGVAHDFNNLLTIIRSSVDFLRRPDLPEARKSRYLDAVSETVERAARLTGQLLAFARRQALTPEVFDVGVKLRGVGDMLDTVTGARIHVTIDVPEQPCFIRADLSQFETALVNMAVNARDAMDGEGKLTLRVACAAPMPPIRGHAASNSAFAAVSVTDTGSGIAPEQLSRIFEPFFTTKEVGKGTGLGLSQVFGFAKQSGGDVDVQSVVGEGTTFTLYLPEVQVERMGMPADDDDLTLAPIGAGQRVLVVEDNIEVGRFCTQILEDLGYATEWAANGEEALDRLGTDGAGFAAVFSDVVMPGMGGVALAEALRERLPDLPVVLASGYSHVLAREADHGFELLHKPYSADQLARVLQRVMSKALPRSAQLARS